MRKKFLVLALAVTSAFSFWSNPAAAQKKAASAGKAASATGELLPIDPDVKIGKLPNGLTYYIRKNTEPNNRAVLYMALKAGSLMETDAQQGLAHFVEHMAFNGTRDFPKNELINYLQKAGVKFGADLNAYTSFDQTVYQLPIPTDSAELFRNGFKILANWAGLVTMEASEIEAERGVIVEEDRQRGKNAQSRMQKEMLPVLLKGSRYADRLPIGQIDIIQNFKHEELRNFYKDWYRPNLQAVIAVGDFDPAEVEALIKKNFGPLKNPANPKPHQVYDLPDNKAPLIKKVTDVEFPYHVALAIIRHRANVPATTVDVRKNLVEGMINTMIGSRINELKQKGTAPFVEGQFSYGEYQGGVVPGVKAATIVAVSKSPEELTGAFKGMMAEVERMAGFGFTASELSVVKKNMEAGNEKSFREKDKTSSNYYVQQYLQHFMHGTAIPSATYRYELMKKLISEISLEEVNKAAKEMISEENVTIVVQAPEKNKDKLPSDAELLNAMRTAGKGVAAYVDNAVNKPLLETKPVAGKVVAEEKIESIGVTKLTLSNGVKVYLKPSEFKNDQIMFTSFATGGTSLIEDKDVMAMGYASNIAGDGIGEFDNSQLRKLLAGTTASVSAYIGELYQGFSGGASPQDLETALQLVYAYATNPRKDPVVFKTNLEDYRLVLSNASVSPDVVYNDTVNGVWTSYSERKRKPQPEDLDKISLDKSFGFYKDRFSDASGQTFVFVGNFEVEKIKPLLETYIGGLPSTNRNEQYIDRGVKPLQGKVEKTVRKGIEDKATVKLVFHGEYDYSLDNNLQMNALKEILQIKIQERLREKESGVYSPGVSLSNGKLPEPYYAFTISFNCAAANVEKLIAATLDEVEKIKKEGAEADDVEKFKAETKRSLEVSLRQNDFWLNYLAAKFRNNEDPTTVLQQSEYMKKVTPASVKAAAGRYLSGENYFRAVLVPEK